MKDKLFDRKSSIRFAYGFFVLLEVISLCEVLKIDVYQAYPWFLLQMSTPHSIVSLVAKITRLSALNGCQIQTKSRSLFNN